MMRLPRNQRNALAHLARSRDGQQPRLPNHFGGWVGFLGKTSASGIPARSGTTAGKAEDVELCMIEDSGEIVETGVMLTVYNPFGSAVGNSAYITLKPINGTRLIVDAEDC